MKADDVIAAARSALGTPFRHQGRIAGVGLDCAGLYIHVCSVLGIECLDFEGYGRLPYRSLLEQACADQPALRRVPLDELQSGDIMLMRFDGSPQHVAFCAGDTMIHAYQQSGGVVEHRLASVWRGRVVRVYRFEGIA